MDIFQIFAMVVALLVVSYALYRISKMDSELEKKLKQ